MGHRGRFPDLGWCMPTVDFVERGAPGFCGWSFGWLLGGEFLDGGEVAVGVGVVDVFDGWSGCLFVAGAREIAAGDL